MSPVKPEHEIQSCYPSISGIPSRQNSVPGLEGNTDDRYQVRFAEAIQTVVGSDPDISFAILKNGQGNIVAQSIPCGERLDRGAEFLDSTP